LHARTCNACWSPVTTPCRLHCRVAEVCALSTRLPSSYRLQRFFSGAARIWRWGHRGSGERKSPSGVQGGSGGIASRKHIAVIKDIWLPNHAQFCVFSSTAQSGIFCEPTFGGRGVPTAPPAAPLRCFAARTQKRDVYTSTIWRRDVATKNPAISARNFFHCHSLSLAPVKS